MNSTQQVAWTRFAKAFDARTGAAAEVFRDVALDPQTSVLTPAHIVNASVSACDDWFCATLVAHNVLRTLGRWKENFDRHTGVDYNLVCLFC